MVAVILHLLVFTCLYLNVAGNCNEICLKFELQTTQCTAKSARIQFSSSNGDVLNQYIFASIKHVILHVILNVGHR